MRINVSKLEVGNRYRIVYPDTKTITRTLLEIDGDVLIFSGDLIIDENENATVLDVIKRATYTGSKWN